MGGVRMWWAKYGSLLRDVFKNVRDFRNALDLLVAETNMQFEHLFQNEVVFIEVNYTKLNTEQIPPERKTSYV